MRLAWIRERSIECSWERGRGESDTHCSGCWGACVLHVNPKCQAVEGQGVQEPLADNDSCAQALYARIPASARFSHQSLKSKSWSQLSQTPSVHQEQEQERTRPGRSISGWKWKWLGIRCRPLMSRISEVIERPPNRFQNTHPFQALRLEPLLCGSIPSPPTLALSPEERSPLSLISHC